MNMGNILGGVASLQDGSKDKLGIPRLDVGPIKVVGRHRRSSSGTSAKAWDARQWLTMATKKRGSEEAEGSGGMGALSIQLVICMAVIAVALVVKTMDVPQSAEVFSGINAVITTDSDLDKAIGKLKFVGSFFGDSKPVFNPETQGLVPPVKDMAVETGGTPQLALSINIPDEITPVLAAADGQVFYAGSSNEYGSLVRIRHQEGYETFYGGINFEVQAGHTVLAGERIGYIKGGVLKFLVYRDGAPIDARSYLKKADGG